MADPEVGGFQPPENGTPEAVMAWLNDRGRASELSAAQKAINFVELLDGPYDQKTQKRLPPIDNLVSQEERRERMEKLRLSYQEYVNALLGPIIDMEGDFDRMHQEVPWESRYGEQTFDMVVNLIDARLRQTRETEETKPMELEKFFLEEAKATALWAQGTFQVLEGSATAIDTYFAGEDQMRQLMTHHIKITETSFEKAFAANLPGLTVAEDQRDENYKYNRKLMSGILSKEFARKEVPGEVESVRELAVKFQDERMQLALMVAEVQQEDFENDSPQKAGASKPRERVSAYFGDGYYKSLKELICEVFAGREDDDSLVKYIHYIDGKKKSHNVPENVLNFYNMEPSEENKRMYKALMQASLSLSVLARLKNGEDPRVLGEEVRKKAKTYLDNRYAEQAFSLRDKLARVIVDAGIDMDWGLMSCGELGWGWNYEKVSAVGIYGLTEEELDAFQAKGIVQVGEIEVKWELLKDGEKELYLQKNPGVTPKDGDKVKFTDQRFMVLRTSGLGSIYTALDVWSPMYVNRHVWDYHANSETTSQMHLATPDAFRREMVGERPDWMPPIEKYLSYNPVLRKLIYKLFTNGYANDQFWDGEKGKYGELDPRVVTYMRKNLNAWPSWPLVDGKSGQFMAMPLFFPSHWLSLNFWRSLGENGKDAREVPSLWERFKEGMKLSEVPFLKYKDLAVDWNNVNKAQFARVLLPLFLPHKLSRDILAEYEKFFPEEPSADGIKELGKRIRLGVRGETAEAGVIEVVLIPYLINVHIFKTTGLMGIAGENGNTVKEKWQRALAKWANEAANLTPTKGLKRSAVKNYNKSLAMLIDFYGTLFLDYAKTASRQTNNQMSEARKNIDGRLDVTKMDDVDVEKVISTIS